MTGYLIGDDRKELQMQKATEIRWTDEDQARHIASVKKDLAELLKDDADFKALQAGPVPPHMTPEECAIYLLRLFVSGLRSELIKWGEEGQP
jgi:hypothetical protein